MIRRIALIPAYQPDKILIKLVTALKQADFLVVVVDDGSGDDYQDIFALVKRDALVIGYPLNKGKGRALKTGLEYIKQEVSRPYVIVTLDADGQHQVEDVIKVTDEAINHTGDLILGSRALQKDVPLRSRIGNTITRLVYRLSTGIKVRDTQTGLRAFTDRLRDFMADIPGERYEYEMNVLLQCPHHQIPIRELTIATVYYDNNRGSHFDTLRDSFLVYEQIFKFIASSFTGFLIDYSLYSFLVLITSGQSFSIPLANVTARIVSAGVNFTINKRLVFKNDDSLTKTASEYFALAAVIMIGNTVLLYCLVNYIHINKFIAKIFTEMIFFVLSWIIQRFVIFAKRREDVS